MSGDARPDQIPTDLRQRDGDDRRFIALGGTAVGALIITSNGQVARNTISGHAPPNGKHPNIIAESLDATDLASGAVGTSKLAPNATAPNAAKLGGLPPSSLQRRVTDACGARRGISSIRADGSVQCSSTVLVPIAVTPGDGEGVSHIPLGPGIAPNLQLDVHCNDGFGTKVEFRNYGPDAGTLNWLYSPANDTVNASGNVVSSFGGEDFFFGGDRIEGQFIFADGEAVTTVSLHAFNGSVGSNCEVRGTAQYVPL